MSYSRLVVGDRFGTILAELSPDITSLSWRLNKVGKCKISLAISDPKAIEDYLKFGNRILIEFENGLPAWGGVFDPPRKWDQRIITCTAYSGEYLLRYRTTDKGRYFSGASVGTIYQALIEEANALEDTGIEIDEIWFGGSGHSPDYHYKDLLMIFQDSLTKRLSTADFDVIASESSGKIVFTTNFYESRGSDKTGIALIQDKNLSRIKLLEQGPIINSWDVAGEGSSWGDTRLTANAQDSTSIAAYGLREGSKVYADVSIQGTLDAHADNLLSVSNNPYNIFELTALDESPAGFADYDLGDIVSLLAPDYGFGGTDLSVRILSREFFPSRGECVLVTQEVL